MQTTYKDGRLKNTHPFLTDTPARLKSATGVAETYVAIVHEAKRKKEEEEEVRIFTLFIPSS